jgi:hypothetical protein
VTPIFDQLCRDLGYTPPRVPRFRIIRFPNIPGFGGVSWAERPWELRDRENPSYVGRFGALGDAVAAMDAIVRGEKVAGC